MMMVNMAGTWEKQLDRAARRLPGWMFLLSGLVMGSTCLLMPAWREHQALQWHLGLMRAQASQFARQEEGYRHFQNALQIGDPLLLERLAFTYLRLKPVGTLPLDDPGRMVAAGGARAASATEFATIEQMLHEPMPAIGKDFSPPRKVDSKLVRLTMGPARPIVLGLSLMCIYVGIVWPLMGHPVRKA